MATLSIQRVCQNLKSSPNFLPLEICNSLWQIEVIGRLPLGHAWNVPQCVRSRCDISRHWFDVTLDAFDVALEVFDVTLEESGRRVLNGTGAEMVCKCLRELLFTFAQSASQAAEAVGFFLIEASSQPGLFWLPRHAFNIIMLRSEALALVLWIWNHAALLWLPNGVNHDMRWMRYVRSSNGQDAICTTWIYQLSSSPHSWQSDNLKWNIFRCVSISRMPKIFWKIQQRPFHLTKKYPFNSSLNHSTGPQTHILWTLEWQNHQWPWNVENIYFESYGQELKLLSFVSFSDTEKLLQSEV